MRVIACLEMEHLSKLSKIEMAKGKMSFKQPLSKIMCGLIDLLPHRQSKIAGGTALRRIFGSKLCL
jgi:hypothetical protein